MQAALEITTLEAVAGEYNLDAVLLANYMENEGYTDIDDAAREFSDHYAGTFDNLEAWGEDFAESTGLLDGIPAHLRYYFDVALWARDQDLGGFIWTMDVPEGIAVFYG